jgi:hypothetical protein
MVSFVSLFENKLAKYSQDFITPNESQGAQGAQVFLCLETI